MKKQKPIGKNKCYFCNETKHLERHHIVQQRFGKYYKGNIDDPENLVWLCPKHHRLYHILTDIMLDTLLPHLSVKKKIRR